MAGGVGRLKSDVVLHDVCCVLARLLTDHVWLLCITVDVVGSLLVVPAAVKRFKCGVVLHDVCFVLARLLTGYLWFVCKYAARFWVVVIVHNRVK